MSVLGLDLRGRLEKVHIEKEYSRNFGIGFFYSQEVIVRNGNLAIGKDCLVKFNLKPKGFVRMANFVSLNVPDNFDGLSSHEYVFLGLWRKEMGRVEYPGLEDIRSHYNPGDIKEVFYMKKDSTFKYGRGFIDENGFVPNDIKVKRLVAKKSYYTKLYSRLIVVESEQQLNKVSDKVRQHGIYPIIMDDLRKVRN